MAGAEAVLLNVSSPDPAEVIRIEEKADHIHDQGRLNLYRRARDSGGPGAMTYIIGAELYDSLEKVVDRFEDVANQISSVLIEHL